MCCVVFSFFVKAFVIIEISDEKKKHWYDYMSAKNFFNTLKSMVKTYGAQKCSELVIELNELKYMDDDFKWFWQINLFGHCCRSHLSKVNKCPEQSFCTLQWISRIHVGVVNRIGSKIMRTVYFLSKFVNGRMKKKINNIITIHRRNSFANIIIIEWNRQTKHCPYIW